MRRSLFAWVIALGLLGLGACSDDTAPVQKDSAVKKEASIAQEAGGGNKEAGGAREAGAAKEAGTSCSLIGTFKGPIPAGPFVGQTNTWEFKAGGTTHAQMASATLDGTWQMTGAAAVKLTDTASTPTTVACPAAQEGTYNLTWSGDCKTVTFKVATEPCDGRKVAVDNFTGTRQ